MQAGCQQSSDARLCHDPVVAHADVAAAILAGGTARRFGGRDKSRLIVRGRPIIVRQVEVLQRVAAQIFIVSNDASRFADLGLDVHPDLVPGAGAMGGVYTALEASRADRVVVVACDMPFLDSAVLNRLVDLAAGADAAWVRSASGPEPLLACYRRGARVAVRRAIDGGRLTLADLATELDVRELAADDLTAFGRVEELLANLNSPADHRKVE
jgi:molybdopterin-guanine dinucleotide biosynthesis protein A